MHTTHRRDPHGHAEAQTQEPRRPVHPAQRAPACARRRLGRAPPPHTGRGPGRTRTTRGRATPRTPDRARPGRRQGQPLRQATRPAHNASYGALGPRTVTARLCSTAGTPRRTSTRAPTRAPLRTPFRTPIGTLIRTRPLRCAPSHGLATGHTLALPVGPGATNPRNRAAHTRGTAPRPVGGSPAAHQRAHHRAFPRARRPPPVPRTQRTTARIAACIATRATARTTSPFISISHSAPAAPGHPRALWRQPAAPRRRTPTH